MAIARAIVVFCVLVLSFATDLAVAGASEPHVLRFTDGRSLATLNPWYGDTLNLALLSELTMAHLTRADRRGRLVPELATAVPSRANGGISADGTTITWHLRHGVRWSDGAAFDARDVLFTIAAEKNPANSFLNRPFSREIARATAPDDYTVVLRMGRVDHTIDHLFTTYTQPCILPRHLLAHLASLDQAPYNALPVGIGPFRYVRFDRDSSVIMEADPGYFRGRPKLARIEYKIVTDDNTIVTQLQTRELDMWVSPAELADRAGRISGIAIVRQTGTFDRLVVFNVERPTLADRRVRQALRLALPRSDFLAKIAHGYGAVTDGFVPPIYSSFDDAPVSPYDPATAIRLLEVAGWHVGSDGIRTKGADRLEVRLIARSGDAGAATAVELIRSAWQRVGVELKSELLAPAEFFPLALHQIRYPTVTFDAVLFAASFDDGRELRQFFGCNRGVPLRFNVPHYCNSAVDRGITRALASFDVANQRRALRTVQDALATDAPAVVMYRLDDVVALAPSVSGFHPTLGTYFDDMLDVDTH